MHEYEIQLADGITTTAQLSDEDAKAYGRAAVKRDQVIISEMRAPELRAAEVDREIAADAETPKRARTTAKETR